MSYYPNSPNVDPYYHRGSSFQSPGMVTPAPDLNPTPGEAKDNPLDKGSSPAAQEPEELLEHAFKALYAKQETHNLFFSYYDGDNPLPYASERLADLLKGVNMNLQENWCRVIIKSVTDRINLKGFTVADNKKAQEKLQELWAEAELSLEAADAHRDALITGESYIIAWKDEEDGEIECYYQDPRLVHVCYEDYNPRKKKWAAKWFNGEDGKGRMIIYTAEMLYYFKADQPLSKLAQAKNFAPDPEEPEAKNPYGEIPVFHLRPERRRTISELKPVLPLQDSINMLVINMVATSEYSAAPQKYVITNGEIDELQNSPNMIWELPAGDGQGQQTSVGQFQAADLGGYMKAIENLVETMATITATPRHFFFRQGGDPSGEALITLEAPLVKKCQDHIERFKATWRTVGAFLLKLAGGGDIKPVDIEPQFESPQTIQPLTAAQIRQTSVATGLPLKTVLRREGWTDSELEEMMKDKAEEAAESAKAQAGAQMASQAAFDKEGMGHAGPIKPPAPPEPDPMQAMMQAAQGMPKPGPGQPGGPGQAPVSSQKAALKAQDAQNKLQATQSKAQAGQPVGTGKPGQPVAAAQANNNLNKKKPSGPAQAQAAAMKQGKKF